MNAQEKLLFEEKAGFYKSAYTYDAQEQLFLDSLYNLHMSNVARGVNTYWLSEPLRVALVHKHNIYAEGETRLYVMGWELLITVRMV